MREVKVLLIVIVLPRTRRFFRIEGLLRLEGGTRQPISIACLGGHLLTRKCGHAQINGELELDGGGLVRGYRTVRPVR